MVYFFNGSADLTLILSCDSFTLYKGPQQVAKTKTTKRTTKAKQKSAGDTEVTVCRRRGDRRQSTSKPTKPTKGAVKEQPVRKDEPIVLPAERRKVPRRRQIDPTTCERDYTADEIEFMHALDAYKRASGRMFPTCSEILEVVRGLGYIRLDDVGVANAVSSQLDAGPVELASSGHAS
jgi:hypothetical protein